jgi:hypothetical protein
VPHHFVDYYCASCRGGSYGDDAGLCRDGICTDGPNDDTNHTHNLYRHGSGDRIFGGHDRGRYSLGRFFCRGGYRQSTGVLVATTDYTPPSPGPNTTNNLVGGGWALLGERGTVFGSFSGGTVQWNADGTLADIVADMSVLGGSVDGVPVSSGGVGTFGGVLDHRPLALGLPPMVDGTLQLTF